MLEIEHFPSHLITPVNTPSIPLRFLPHRPSGPRPCRSLRRRGPGSCAMPVSTQVARRYGFQGSDKIDEGRSFKAPGLGRGRRGSWVLGTCVAMLGMGLGRSGFVLGGGGFGRVTR